MSKFAKEQIARQFSRAAGTYDIAAQLQNKMANQLISNIPDSLNGKLVDLGCGTGWALAQIEELKQFSLTAIDIAPGMIEVAKSRVTDATFVCCDLEETGLPDNQADVVFSNAAIQWCDSLSAFREMKRICKPSGLIVCSTFGPATLGEIRTAWNESGDDFDRVHRLESSEAIETTLKDLGFKEFKIETELKAIPFDSVEKLLKSIKQIGATNASATRPTGLMGPKRYRKFWGVLESRLERDGHLELTFECIFVKASL